MNNKPLHSKPIQVMTYYSKWFLISTFGLFCVSIDGQTKKAKMSYNRAKIEINIYVWIKDPSCFQRSVNFSDPMFDLTIVLYVQDQVSKPSSTFLDKMCAQTYRYFSTDFHFLFSTLSFEKILDQCHLLWKHCSMHHTVYSMYIPPRTVHKSYNRNGLFEKTHSEWFENKS